MHRLQAQILQLQARPSTRFFCTAEFASHMSRLTEQHQTATLLLLTPQALMADPRTAALVKAYSMNPYLFSYDFAESMAKMSKIGYSPGKMGRSGSPVGLLTKLVSVMN
ncbi:hypothetical protein WN944_028873 [Citrus x changshan-huyou]|uniref:Uncharacterized protein n=1 Tax=Citrus x changshan-huyou TaxID=2935761 RepID=A0AAP0QB79_9ROSI